MTTLLRVNCLDYEDIKLVYDYALKKNIDCAVIYFDYKGIQLFSIYLKAEKKRHDGIRQFCGRKLGQNEEKRHWTAALNPKTVVLREKDVIRKLCIGDPEEFCDEEKGPKWLPSEQ